MDIVDMLVLIAIIAIVALMVILSLMRVRSRAHPVVGSSNLKQARLSYRIVEHGCETRCPMAVFATPPEFRNEPIIINSPSRFP